MTKIVAGTETYGRIKNVDGTPVVTQFAMLYWIPLWPVRSFYLSRLGETKAGGILFLASRTEREIVGVQLNRICTASVLFGYLRGLIGTVFLLGMLFSIVSLMSGGGPRGAPPWIENALYLITAVSAVLGGITYLIPLTSPREKMIRQHCGTILKLAIDPALIKPEDARSILAELPEIWARCSSASSNDEEREELKMICKLIQTRCKLSGKRSAKLESRSDELLASLNA